MEVSPNGIQVALFLGIEQTLPCGKKKNCLRKIIWKMYKSTSRSISHQFAAFSQSFRIIIFVYFFWLGWLFTTWIGNPFTFTTPWPMQTRTPTTLPRNRLVVRWASAKGRLATRERSMLQWVLQDCWDIWDYLQWNPAESLWLRRQL